MSKKALACRLVELPNNEKIDSQIAEFDRDQRINEAAVKAAFSSLDNKLVEDIMVKVIVLNSRYSTRLSDNKPAKQTVEKALTNNRGFMPDVLTVAQRIAEFEAQGKFDSCGDTSDVAKLIKDFLCFPKPYSQPYSFITKYCSFRLPDIDIPIVDNYVRALLIVFNEKDRYYGEEITNSLLADYSQFLNVINAFSEKYAKGYSYKDIDKYLWQYGKDLFEDGFDIRNIL